MAGREVGQGLSAPGLRAGLVTEDQTGNLVDTDLLWVQSVATDEIPGDCFGA